ncbi:hypothetical protein A1359_12505 [Methylomonas lenta]|uniref:Uncharacterized protein n=1 Tax=Methylomonas lenta TaxID=980561 RepID=A0A177N5C4_9GAMM|nr:hypothetical protein A1359_12505 [Methylomonas lenta]
MPSRASKFLSRVARKGRGRDMPRVFRGARKPLRKTLDKSEKRRIKAASGRPFLWFLSFGRAKERNSAVGPRPDFKLASRSVTLIRLSLNCTRNAAVT